MSYLVGGIGKIGSLWKNKDLYLHNIKYYFKWIKDTR